MNSSAETLCYIGRRMFERRLTDMAGGNISIRSGDQIYISPRYAGSKQHWQLAPTDIVVGSLLDDEILAHPRFSREGKAHVAIYRSFPDVGAVIHAHPFHILPFCVAERPIEPVLEGTQKFGVVSVVKGAKANGDELAGNVAAGFVGKEAMIRTQAAAVIAPRHGIFVAGKEIFATLDALERIDWNAWCIMAQASIPTLPIAYTPPGTGAISYD
ncbi:MAG: class II aldolase/adducin family protein [Caldilineaceae bacterium]